MQNTNTAGSPATPDLSASVNASQLANPATIVTPTPSAGETGDGGDLAPETTNDGSHDWGQWIAIGIISLTIVSLVMNIVVNRRSLVKLNQDDAMQKERITKLEARLEILENPQPVRRAA
jgi:heme exporter protein D